MSTQQAQANTTTLLTIGGEEWRIDRSVPRIHSDGLAPDRIREHLCFRALTGRTLYRTETRRYLDGALSKQGLGVSVGRAGETGAAPGIKFGV